MLQFNLALSRAIEKFDGVEEGSKDYCSNHISFCSKYLHFYYPHSVFIIDSYAEAGAGQLFKSVQNKKTACICSADGRVRTEDPLSDDVYSAFDRQRARKQALKIFEGLGQLVQEYDERKRSPMDENKAVGYVTHCVRSYMLACKLKAAGIEPESQLPNRQLCPMPRLTDAVFLNIKQI